LSVTKQDIAWDDKSVRASRLGVVEEHALEADISRLVELAEVGRNDAALDMVTGLGHVARALAIEARQVDAFDPDEEILRGAMKLTERAGIKNINFFVGSPLSLPCEEKAYDIVTARMALRHLADGSGLLKEAHRFINSDGRLILADALAPPHAELVSFLENMLALYDQSHLKAYTLAELETILEKAGFYIDNIEIYPKEHVFDSWSKQLGADEESIRMLASLLHSAGTRAKRHFRIIEDDQKVVSFVTWMILIRARPDELA